MIDMDALRRLIREEIEAAAPPVDDRVLLTVPEAARALGMATRTAYDRINEGRLKAVRDGGRLRILRQAVDDYAAGLDQIALGNRNVKSKRRSNRRQVDSEAW